MDLKDTVNGMLSKDYKERFKAEYYQTQIRLSKLKALLQKNDKDLGFKLSSPKDLYKMQINGMKIYLKALECRAKDEGIELEIDKTVYDY